ncbi:glycosyltransferase family 2 protein [Neobacillus muris]|uniref:glycosyltransferase family 2 protein n=1 Tax=Neobacillus muris TaxID=2941334 RepID=UPI00203E55EC|nr:glycosyltransferase family 2 protein [Neobacillus muris]
MGNNKLAVIVLNYNDYTTTNYLIHSIKDYSAIDRIVVVDNCSTNDSYERLLNNQSNKCHVIKSDRNGGYAYGNNVGIRYAIDSFDSDMIVIANPDVLFTNETVEEIKYLLQTTPYALLAPVMNDINGNISNAPYWDLPNYQFDLGMCFSVYRKRNSKKIRKVNFSQKIMDVDVLPGSFLAFKRDALEQVGLFDQTLFLYCEERIISFRLKKQGYKCGLVTDVYYDHMHSVTTKKYLKELQINKLMMKARYYFEVEYNKIGAFKRAALKVAMGYSTIEMTILALIKQMCGRRRKIGQF